MQEFLYERKILMAQLTQKQYSEIVDKHSPKSPIFSDTLKAFLVGGIICCIGEFFMTLYKDLGFSKEISGTLTSISLIFIAAILTALNRFDKIAKFSGAGTLVPITGFSNSVVSPAMEFKSEGLILGMATRMFTVAGPVIVYGIVSSILAGFILWIF